MKELKEIIKICENTEKCNVIEDIQNICEKQLLAEELNEMFGFNLSYNDIHSKDWIRISNYYGDMSIGIWGVDYNRTICNIQEQPINERLFSICFPTGAYIFGEDYPKELFNRFYSELETYNPKYNDKINHCLYFDLDNGVKIYKEYRNILGRYQKEHNDGAKQRKIEELQKQIDRLKQD